MLKKISFNKRVIILPMSILFVAVINVANVSAYTLRKEMPYGELPHVSEITTHAKGADIALIKSQISLWKACTGEPGYKLSYTSHFEKSWFDASKEHYEYDDDGSTGTENYKVSGDSLTNCSIGNKTDVAPDSNDEIKLVFPDAAEDVYDGTKYNVHMTLSNFSYKIGVASDNGDTGNSTAVIYGYPSKYGYDTMFSGFHYHGYAKNWTGVKFDVTIKLKTDSGKTPADDKKMIWAFDDIDIGDATDSSYHPYDSNYTFAEHVKPLENISDDIVVVGKDENGNQRSILDIYDDDSIYHPYDPSTYKNNKGEDSPDGGVDDNSANLLMTAKAKEFKFEWGGSDCGTRIIDAPYGVFMKYTYLDYGNQTNIENNSQITVHGPTSEKINFRHAIEMVDNHRDGSYKAKYYIDADNGQSYGSAKKPKTTSTSYSSKGDWEEVKSKGEFTLSLDPDQAKSAWQNLYYARSNLKDVFVNQPTKYTACGENGRKCLNLYRPPAWFTADIGITAKTDNGTATTRKPGETLTTIDGSYSITFNNSLSRNDTITRGEQCFNGVVKAPCSGFGLAGGKVKTDYSIYYTVEYQSKNYNSNTLQNHYMETKTFTSGNTGELGHGDPASISNFVINSTLEPGMRVTYCEHLVYGYRKSGTGTIDVGANNSRCITITRPEKTCKLDASYGYGVNGGHNIGRISVTNKTNGQTSASGTSGTSFSSYALGYDNRNINKDEATEAASIWAKPTDEIQFKYEMCAGAYYTMEANTNNKDRAAALKSNYTSQVYNLSARGYGVHYGAYGFLARNNGTQIITNNASNTDGYLFGSFIPLGPNGSSYSNPTNFDNSNRARRWTTGQNGNALTFNGDLVNRYYGAVEKATEATYYSPSSTNTSYNGAAGYYKIQGKSSGNKISLDVGGIIRQELHWNNFNINGVNRDYQEVVDNPKTGAKHIELKSVSVSNTTDTNPGTRYAFASVKVPYNYILKPYVTNKDNINDGESDHHGTVYMGGTTKMTAGVGVQGRTNTAVSTSKYATITKPTYYKISYQFRYQSNGYLPHDSWTFKTSDGGNPQRYSVGENLADTSGHDITTVNINIPDNDPSLHVGDQVCVKLEVWPADSHDLGTSQSINGDNGGVALSETGTSTAYNISCSTIAKRPTMSVESANAYSANGYNVQRYSKNISSSAGVGSFTFASWGEYGVFGKITNYDHHLVSGAATGYRRDQWYGSQNPNNTRDNPTDSSVAMNSNTTTCTFMTQTIANVDCNKDTKSTANNNASFGGVSVAQYKRKMTDRYLGANSNVKTLTSADVSNYRNSGKACYGIKVTRGISNSIKPRKQAVLSNGTLAGYLTNNENPLVLKVNDDNLCFDEASFTVKTSDNTFKNLVDGKKFNHTVVIDARGKTLIIDNNIEFNKDLANKDINDVFNVIIFAKNVWFTSNPTHIDATIITDDGNDDTYTAEVNTCRFNMIDSANYDSISDVKQLDSDKCNKSLIFDAPVITEKLIMNRTFGAGSQGESIQRAEIFNLNMANYLWSYSQMSRYSQAITTYSRELPSRY